MTTLCGCQKKLVIRKIQSPNIRLCDSCQQTWQRKRVDGKKKDAAFLPVASQNERFVDRILPAMTYIGELFVDKVPSDMPHIHD